MKEIKLLILILFITSFIGCSSDEVDNDVPVLTTTKTDETFGDWTPNFTDQTTSFTQTRTGSNGTQQSRTIEVSSTSNSTYSNEGDIYQDINGDGDTEDSVEIINITYVASENLGQFDSVNNIVNLNNETPILEFNYQSFPNQPTYVEGLGYISLNSKHYILIPFASLGRDGATTPDYLRVFEIDSINEKLHDRTFSIYNEIPEIGFPKGPLFVEDFDNDGFDDLFLVDHGQENSFINNRFEGDFLKFYYGSENGFIKDQTPEISNKKLFYHHADVSDFDLDGDLDIISQRWPSQTEELAGGVGNSISLFKNLGNRNYEIIDLESPPAGVGSVLFSNIDDDPELEVLSFAYGGGMIWSWDILENKTEIINNQLGEYQIHDVVEIENNNNSSIIIFPESYPGTDPPVLISTDKCENINSFDFYNDFQGSDIYVIDLNNDGLDDLFMYYGTDGEFPVPSSRSFVNSVLINQGNNRFSYPSNVKDIYNKLYNDERTSSEYLPIKQTSNGYMFFKFMDYSTNGIYPISGKLIDLSFN